jgi:hypothetical protein
MENNFLVLIFAKLGTPFLGGTIVACLLTMRFEWIHASLMAIGFIALCIDVSITMKLRREN